MRHGNSRWRNRFQYWIVLAALAGLGADGSSTRANRPLIPPGAQRQEVSEAVTLHHWTEPLADGKELRVRFVAKVSQWPEGRWGAEVTMTPIPDCCGANPETVRFRKSEPLQARSIGIIDAASSYRLDFRFR